MTFEYKFGKKKSDTSEPTLSKKSQKKLKNR